MKSTGEVMGVGKTFGEAFYKAVLGQNERVPGLPNRRRSEACIYSLCVIQTSLVLLVLRSNW